MLVMRYRQRQKFYETMLLTADTSNPAHKQFYEDSLNSYREAMFPYISKVESDEKERTKKFLDKAFADGPILIKDGAIQMK